MKKVESSAEFFTDEKTGDKIYNVSKSRLVSLINWMQVARRFLPIIWFLAVGKLCYEVGLILINNGFDFKTIISKEVSTLTLENSVAFDLGWKSMLLVAFLIFFVNRYENPVYLLDFSTFEPPDSWKVSAEQLLEIMKLQECFTEESLAFQERMLAASGVGPSTAWPPGIVRCLNTRGKSDRSAEAARKESEVVIFNVVEQVLASTGIQPKNIDILVINCSLFSPTPSLCSMVVNKFGLRSDISSYNLSGMGCSAGLISVELVKNLLASRPNSTALIVSTENLTQNLYHGNSRGFLLQNTLFRCGGAAIICTNKWTDAFRARFKLLHVVRTQYVNEDSLGCVYETEDEHNERGVRLSKDIVKVAGRAMEKNFTTLGPYVLPVSEQAKTGFWMLVRWLAKKFNAGKVAPYIPDFKRGIDHFCIHAGGRGVIDGIEKNLSLTKEHVAASRYALYTYGNTSSSSIWYEMDYVRRHGKLSRGQRVLQVAFGSGFKCNSGVWLCMNNPPAKIAVPPVVPVPGLEKEQKKDQ